MDCCKWDILLSSMVLQINNVKQGFCCEHGAMNTITETLMTKAKHLSSASSFPYLHVFSFFFPIQGWRLTGDRFSDELGWSLHQLPSGFQRLLHEKFLKKKSIRDGVNLFPGPLIDIIHNKHGNTHSYTRTRILLTYQLCYTSTKNKTQRSVMEFWESEWEKTEV